jgi:hypothetical protein
MSDLGLLSKDLDDKLQRAPLNRQRAASLAACQFAVAKAKLSDPLVDAALQALQTGRVFQSDFKAELDALAEQLDEEYFTLKEAADEGRGNSKEYMSLFAKARAVAALSCAGDQDAAKIGEAIYEAAFTIESDDKGEFLPLIDAELNAFS